MGERKEKIETNYYLNWITQIIYIQKYSFALPSPYQAPPTTPLPLLATNSTALWLHYSLARFTFMAEGSIYIQKWKKIKEIRKTMLFRWGWTKRNEAIISQSAIYHNY